MRYILINSARSRFWIWLSLSLLPIRFLPATIFLSIIMRQNTLLYIISWITLHKYYRKIHLSRSYASSMISSTPDRLSPLSFSLFFLKYHCFRWPIFFQMGNRLKAYHIKKRQTIELEILIGDLQQRLRIPNSHYILPFLLPHWILWMLS